jgi:hypothetical protein
MRSFAAAILFAAGIHALAQEKADMRAWGAIGDGKADDTVAIQKAVAAGGSVRFPTGTWRLTKTVTVELAKSGYTSLVGEGTARIVMEGAGPAFRLIGTHQGSAEPRTLKAVTLERERMPMIDGLEIVGAHEEADGIEAKGTVQLTITRTRISGVRHGVHLVERNRNVTISASHIYDCRAVGIFLDAVNLHQTNITGSHISYCRGGGVVSRGGEVRNLHISGCDIESNMAAGLPETANVLLDSRGGSVAEVAISGCTLQHNSVSPGSANIRIIGPGDEPRAPDEAGKKTLEGNAAITGNVFSDVRVNVHLQHARGVVLTGNTFWEGYDHDLLVEESSNVIVGPNNFDRNPRYELWQKEPPKQGIIFRGCEDSSVMGLHANGVRGHVAALILERCRRMHISDCTILDPENDGILLRKCRDVLVHGNFIRASHEGFRSAVVDGGEGVRVDELGAK